jgi:hypothetical protein
LIRKILFGLFCIYLAIWLSAAYIIENKLQNFATQNDGFTYNHINISGFPNKFTFELVNPVIKAEDNSVAINLDHITLNVNLTFTRFLLELSKKGTLTFVGEDEEKVCDLAFRSNPQLVFKRKNQFFAKNSFFGFASLHIADNIINVTSSEKDLFNIASKDIAITRIIDGGNNNFLMQCDLSYMGALDFLDFSSLRMDALQEITLGFDAKDKKFFFTSFDTKHFDIIVDDAAELHLSGKINFVRDEFPNGAFTLDLIHSNELIDTLWDSSLDLSAEAVKNMLIKASGEAVSEHISLPVIFSTNGLTIGGSSWQELKRGE